LKSCPTKIGQLKKAEYWASPNQGTPDLFNACFLKSPVECGVPDNRFGTQPTFEGKGYAGIYYGESEREYIQVELAKPLRRGEYYAIQFEASNADLQKSGFPVLGVYFTLSPTEQKNWDFVKLKLGTKKLEYIPPTTLSEWTRMSATYQATGGERYLTIGYFDSLDHKAYTYIDEVSLIKIETSYALDNETDEDGFTRKSLALKLSTPQLANHIPNPGFDDLQDCPVAREHLFQAKKWTASRNTPDIYHFCGTGSSSVPENPLGYQTPRSGKGYSGFWAYLNKLPEYREFIQSQMIYPMKKDKVYCVSFYASLAGTSEAAVEELQMVFTNPRIVDRKTNSFIQGTANLQYDGPIQQKGEWEFIYGLYIATGKETHINIGNFKSDTETALYSIASNQQTSKLLDDSYRKSSYYYVDDVAVIPITHPNCQCPPELIQAIRASLQMPEPDAPTLPPPPGTTESNPPTSDTPTSTEWASETVEEAYNWGLEEDDYETAVFKSGERTVLKNILFETGSSTLLPPSFPELDKVLRFMLNNPDYSITIIGHTDNVGTEESNQQLSINRSEAVRTYLTKRDIAPDRITCLGMGELVPIADNEFPEGREQNRRVEIQAYH